jgi:Flp pilus assembly protein TadB
VSEPSVTLLRLGTALDRLGAHWPGTPGVADEFAAGLSLLGVEHPPGRVVGGCYLAGAAVSAVVAGVGLWLPSVAPAVALAISVALGGSLALGLLVGPRWLVTTRRARRVGGAPALVSRLVLRMRLSAAPERAAGFAADGDGPLADDLADHVGRARGSTGSGLRSFAEAWHDDAPSLARAMHLVDTAGELQGADRTRALERARAVSLAGARDRAAAYASSLRGPATALYAFGVLLPLALVALLPAAATAGVGLTTGLVVLLYDVGLPAVIAVTGIRLVARRPTAFPPPAVDRSHPAVPTSRRRPILAGLLAGGCAALIAAAVLPAWGPILAFVGIGTGTALVLAGRPYRRVHDRVREAEAGLVDAVTTVGHRVATGVAVETAIADVGEREAGPTGALFAAASTRQRRLACDLERAFRGPGGPLERLPSRRLDATVSVLALAAREGRPVGDTLVDLADHLEDLRTLEADARRDLSRVTDTLTQTASVFAPLVGGATVALAEGMRGGLAGMGGASATPLAPPTGSAAGLPSLALPVGVYVLLLAGLLSGLATGLERGLDRTLLLERVGRSLLLATPTFGGAYLLASGLL